jgi:hypothetical protein
MHRRGAEYAEIIRMSLVIYAIRFTFHVSRFTFHE